MIHFNEEKIPKKTATTGDHNRSQVIIPKKLTDASKDFNGFYAPPAHFFSFGKKKEDIGHINCISRTREPEKDKDFRQQLGDR